LRGGLRRQADRTEEAVRSLLRLTLIVLALMVLTLNVLALIGAALVRRP